VSAYTEALLVTIAVEVPIVALIYAELRWRMAVVALVATSATHYAMHQPLRGFFAGTGHPVLYAEIAVVLAEAVVLFAASRHQRYEGRRATTAIGASLVANAASYVVGLYTLG
jgi:hypothetical protein